MCHEYTSRAWDREHELIDADEESDDGTPEFANEDGGDEVELLTDGGDEE